MANDLSGITINIEIRSLNAHEHSSVMHDIVSNKKILVNTMCLLHSITRAHTRTYSPIPSSKSLLFHYYISFVENHLEHDAITLTRERISFRHISFAITDVKDQTQTIDFQSQFFGVWAASANICCLRYFVITQKFRLHSF